MSYLNARLSVMSLGAAILAATLSSVHAQTPFPSHPISFVVPFEAGGASDINSRIIGQEMSKNLGQAVVVENRPGATGLIGLDVVAKSKPDGYSIVMIATPSMLAYYRQNRPFDMNKTFSPIGQMYSQYTLMVVNPNVPEMAGIRDVRELLNYAKANPGKLNYTSIGPASVGHLTMERVLKKTGVKMEHIPYKGQTPALNDVIAGRVPMMSGTLSITSFVKDGRVRAIGVAAPKRADALPDIPTLIEQGFPGMIGGAFVGVAAAPATPLPLVNRLSEALKAAVASSEFSKRMVLSSADPEYLGPADFAARVNRDFAAWTQVMRDSGIELE